MPTELKSPTTTKRGRTRALVQHGMPTHLPPTHPGEMLREDFVVPLGITQPPSGPRSVAAPAVLREHSAS